MKSLITILSLTLSLQAHAIMVDPADGDLCSLAAEKAITKQMKRERVRGSVSYIQVENQDFVAGQGPYYVTFSLAETNGDCFNYFEVRTQMRGLSCEVQSVNDQTDEVDHCS